MRLPDDSTLDHLREVLGAENDEPLGTGPRTAAGPVPSFGPIGQGRFRVNATLGDGGMGSVYTAIDQKTGQAVAIKLIHVGDTAQDRRFDREVELLSWLRHPNIVEYVAHGVGDGGSRYLATELLRGRPLSARIAKGTLGLREVIAIGRAIADALSYIHGRGVIHRDVKPANIVLSDDDRIKLIDFGIAIGGTTATLTLPGYAVGTPGYAAPEQMRGGLVGAASDIFALGKTLIEAATGKAPEVVQEISDLVAVFSGGEPAPEGDGQGTLPFAIAALLTSMIAPEPGQRPNATTVRDRLDRMARDLDRIGALAGHAARAAATPDLLTATLGTTTIPDTPRRDRRAAGPEVVEARRASSHATAVVDPMDLLWVDPSCMAVPGTHADVEAVAIARMGAAGGDGESIARDLTIHAAFDPYRRLRTLAAHALARDISGARALAELSLRHGRYLGSIESERVAGRFLETLPESARAELVRSVDGALVEAGRLRKLRAATGTFVVAMGSVGDDRLLIVAAPSASNALVAASGRSVRVLLIPLAGVNPSGAAWRLQAVATVGR